MSDQALGGALMKVLSLFSYGIPFILIFFRWYRRESRSRHLPVHLPPQPGS
ncbi:MAG: hypothetical protein OXM87_01515 [Truepera sp.]|nr:hypothetical protein [Truepera sp.]